MQLSIIIVNYNVKYFLEHCLHSVLAASKNLLCEIIVVDNNSKDDSNAMVEEKFPTVVLIKNDMNIGFAKANNQAFHIAQGKYILYLNPDTIVPEDCFEKCFAYMEQHENAGALGCRLIDGKGQFLPESKRGYPSAWAAFCKISGLSSLFKKSKKFNQYHMGFLAENEIAEVDILVGCFMFCRKKVLDITGSFSEEYFMYGEDIDLSHKIIEAGYKNIYFPETTVIHYKGESTKKGSMNYVKMFYNAMLVFARKNFSGSNKNLYILFITLAIYFRQCIAFFQRIFSLLSLPLLDIFILTASLYSMKTIWETFIKTETEYLPKVLILFFISYILIWVSALFFNGAYDKPYKSSRVLRGMLLGSIIILIFYSLLNESWRFSRGITLLGAILGTVGILFFRVLLQKLNVKSVETAEQQNKKVLLVGDAQEEEEIKNLLENAHLKKNILGAISPFETKKNFHISNFNDLKPISKIYEVGEIIFAQHNLSFKQIIEEIENCGAAIDYKIHTLGTTSIIGSNSKNTAGDLYATEMIYEINTSASKRNKRVVDILFSLLFLILAPLLIWFVNDKKNYIKHCLLILEGDKTFVGYDDTQFPKVKSFIIQTYTNHENYFLPPENVEHLNWLYAKNYSAWTDVKLIVENWRML